MNEGQRRNPVDRLPVFIAAVLLSGLGALMYEISSQFSYMLGTTYGFGEGSQGDFLASFFAGYSLIAITMVFWVRQVDWRVIAAAFSLAGGGGFAAMLIMKQYLLLVAAMFIAGCGLGACYALSLTIFGDTDPVGMEAALSCARRWKEGGCDVTISRPEGDCHD